MTAATERGWLPDFVYLGGQFESGVAMFADNQGRITRFSKSPDDLQKARTLPNKALLPGLVNVHSHSFQRAIRARTEHRTEASRSTFWTWRQAMYHAANRLSPEDIYNVARMAFLEMLSSGITTVGEFHYLHHAPDGTPYSNRNLLAEKVLVQTGRDQAMMTECNGLFQSKHYSRDGISTDRSSFYASAGTQVSN